MNNNYDIIIIGGGISGLYTALKLSEIFKVLLVDDRNYIGGRIVTFYDKINNKNIKYEIGAGRFNDRHKLLLKLIKEFKLTQIPLPTSVNNQYLQVSNDKLVYIDYNCSQIFTDKIKELIKYAKKLSKNKLQSMTFDELIIEYFKSKELMIQLKNIFGYDAEFSILNAYDAIRSFKKDFLVSKFYIIEEGFSELCYRMSKKIKQNGSLIINNTIVQNVIYDEMSKKYNCTIELKYNPMYHTKNTIDIKKTIKIIQNKIFNVNVNKVIFCIKPRQLQKFKILSSLNVHINSVIPSELIRVYAIYPKNNITKKVWFYGLPKITTNNQLRQIIPINYKTGLIMISYVDYKDCDIIKKKYKQNKLKSFIHSNLNILFPNLDIPNPTFFKYYYWKEGAHYWKKNINSDIISNKMIKPFDNKEIYIGGEGFSQNQAWVEGGLETSNKILNKLIK